MTSSLPPHPSLENLKKQAKTLQKKWKSGDPAILARIRAAHPRYGSMSDPQLQAVEPRLADCQFVLAHEAGFASWPQLKVAVEAAHREAGDEFVTLACLCHDDPHYDHRNFHARAHEMLVSRPELAEANIWAASAAGNVDAVRAFLDEDRARVNQPGAHGWEPLICACYSRVAPLHPDHSTYEVARLLLDRGADPNAFTWKHNDPPGSDRARKFTALTGVFGGGSTGLANQPRHPRWRELAELLLQRGADPADDQALWINPADSLELLLQHGLKNDARSRSRRADITLLGRELWRAARIGPIERVKLLLDHGARADERFEGKTPWQHAMEYGNLDIANLLEAAGAPTVELNPVDRFVAVCLAGDERGVREMLDRDPGLLARVPKDLVLRAERTRRTAAVGLAIDLGFDVNFVDDNTALGSAAWRADEEMVQYLLSCGAQLSLRDPWYDGTAVSGADFFNHTGLRDKLLNEAPIDLFDAMQFGRLDRIPDILARDPDALERPFAAYLSRPPKPEDWQTPLTRAVDRGDTEAVRVLLQNAASVHSRHPDGRTLIQLARDNGYAEIVTVLEQMS